MWAKSLIYSQIVFYSVRKLTRINGVNESDTRCRYSMSMKYHTIYREPESRWAMTRRYELNISSVKCGNIIIFPTNHQVDFCLIIINALPNSLLVNLREKKGNFEGKYPLPVFCNSFSIVVLCTTAAQLRLRIRTGSKPRCLY